MCVCAEGHTAGELRDQCQPSFPADVCVCACFVCVWGGGEVELLGSEDSGEGQKSAECVFICVCGSNYCFPPACVYVCEGCLASLSERSH